MGRGRRITPEVKLSIARKVFDGQELAAIAAELALHPVSVSRLKNDAEFQAIQSELEQEAVSRFRSGLARRCSSILEGLADLASMEHGNEVVNESFTRQENGRKVRVHRRTVKVEPKILFVKYQSQERLLEAFLRVGEGQASAQATERLLELRERLLSAYGIIAPRTLRAHAKGQRPEKTAEGREEATALYFLPTEERSLAELLAEMLPQGGEEL